MFERKTIYFPLNFAFSWKRLRTFTMVEIVLRRFFNFDFLILTIMSLRIFSITCMSPWRKTWTFIWKEINHLHLSMFYAISRGNGPSHYGEKKNCNSSIFAFLLSPLQKRAWPFIWIILNSIHTDWFVPSLVESGQVVPMKMTMKMWNVCIKKSEQTDRRSEKLTWALSTGELKITHANSISNLSIM